HVAVHRNGRTAVVAHRRRRAAGHVRRRRAAPGGTRRARDVGPRLPVVRTSARTTADQQGEHGPRHPTTNLSDSSHEFLQPVRATRSCLIPTRTPRTAESSSDHATPTNLTQGHAV